AGEQTLAVHPKSTAASVLKPPVMAGSVKTAIAGPRPERYPLFDKENCAIGIAGDGSHLKIADPGASSLLDFDLGDTITLEAWVNCTRLSNDQQIYILGKGRTQRSEERRVGKECRSRWSTCRKKKNKRVAVEY